ncbi:MAG TPA: DNA repair protein RecO [Actinomycetota bacterium]|nr:DNA repair protein RecO [Actinomycetota bacterium]
MPLYKEQGIVLRSVKLGEADKIVTVMTQGSGKVRAVAKGIRKTTSRFGARLEPFTHVSLMVYRGRGSLDTVSQAEIVDPFRGIRDDLDRFASGETMLEAVDKVAEEHERNLRLFMLLLAGMRTLDRRPSDPAAVAESFLLKLLSLSGFHPSLTACAVCSRPGPALFSSGQGGGVCSNCAELDAGPASPPAFALLASLASCDLPAAGDVTAGPVDPLIRREARAMLFGFAEYHLERRMRSLPILARSLTT